MESVSFTSLPLRTVLHAVAARIHSKHDYAICSVYLAPSVPVSKADLSDLFVQLSPLLLF